MPWKECKPMDERLRFVARLLEGEQMARLCREFGISRVTGYKIFNRYRECGLDGLYDRSRRPYRHANKLPFQVERCILGIKREHPSWGAPKVRDKLIRQFPMIKAPAISTVHAILDRNGLVIACSMHARTPIGPACRCKSLKSVAPSGRMSPKSGTAVSALTACAASRALVSPGLPGVRVSSSAHTIRRSSGNLARSACATANRFPALNATATA